MHLLDVDDDALQHIFERFPDADLVSAAFTCRRFAYLTGHARRQRKLATKYAVIEIAATEYPEVAISRLSRQPLLSTFVTTLVFNPACVECDTNTTRPAPPERRFMEMVIGRCAFLPDERRRVWTDEARKGSPNAVFLVILVWCRYVTSVVLDSPSGEFMAALRHLYTRWTAFGGTGDNDLELPRIVHLEVTRLGDYVCPHYFSFHDIVDLVCLPHLQSCLSRQMHGRYSHPDPLFLPGVPVENYDLSTSLRSCGLQSLEIFGVAIQPVELHDLIIDLPTLRVLRFHDHHDFQNFSDDQHDGLVRYAQLLEEKLRLTNRPDWSVVPDVRSLRIVRTTLFEDL